MSDDFTTNPRGDDDKTSARYHHRPTSIGTMGNSSPTDRSSEQKNTRGDRAAVADLPRAIRNRLDPHWSDWTLLSEDEARYLVATDHCRFFTLNQRGRWEEIRGRIIGSTDPWVCLERASTNPNKRTRSDGGGSSRSDRGADGYDTPSAEDRAALADYQPEGTRTDHDLRLRYLDDQGEPVPDIKYTVRLQSQEYTGRLDDNGEAVLHYLPAGEAKIHYEADHSRLPQLRQDLKTLLDNIIDERSDRKAMLDDLLAESDFVEQGLILTGAFMVSLWDSAVDLKNTAVDAIVGTADGVAAASAALYEKLADGYSLDELEDDFAYVVTEAGHAIDQAQKAYTVLKWLATDDETWALLVGFPKRFFNSMSTVEKVEALGSLAFDILFAIALAVATALTAGAAAAVAGSAAAIKYSRYFTDTIGTLRRIYRLLPTGEIEKRYDRVQIRQPEERHTGQYRTRQATLTQPGENKTHSDSTTDTDESTLCEAHSTTCGDPINMLTGEELFSHVDFELGGPLPLVWKRLYRSTASARQSELGCGWSHPFDQSLTLKADQLIHRDAEGASISFPLPASGGRVRNQWGTVLRRFDDHLTVQQTNGLWHFEPDPDQPERWRLSQWSTPDRKHSWQLHYDQGALTRATATWGARLNFISGQRSSSQPGWHRITGRAGPHVQERTLAHYRLDRHGDLIAARDALGGLEQYRYHHHLFRLRRTATGLTFRFDWDGTEPTARCTRQYADSGEYDYHFDWDTPNRTSRTTDSRGYTETFVFDAEGHLTQHTRADGSIERWDYDSQGRLRTHTDPLGNATRFEHDAQDRLVKRIDALGNEYKLHYWNDSPHPSQIIDPLGRRTAYRYNNDGQLISSRHPDGTEERWAYRGDHLIAHRDHAGREHRYLWDERGQLTRHLCLGIALDDDIPWHRTSNARRDERIAPPDDWRVFQPLDRIEYAPKSENTQYAAKDNGEAKNDGTWLNHPLVTVLADTRFGYDDQGRLHTRTDLNGREQHYQYDDHGRLITQINEHNQAWRYDYDKAGRLVSQTDPGGRTTRLRYGPFAQPEAKILPNGREIRYEYDTERNLTALINGNGRDHRFEYDGCERLTREIGVDGRTTEYRYNEAGHLIGLTEGPITADFERDALGQLIREQYRHAERPEAATWTEYQYSALGQLIGARNDHAEHRFEFDQVGRLTFDQIRQHFRGHYNKVRPHQHDQCFEYSAFDRPFRVQHSAVTAKPQDHELSWLMRDTRHRGWEERIDWDDYGRLHGMTLTLPNDRSYRPEHVVPLLRQRYSDQGLLTERTQGQHQLLFDYDPEQRLSRYRRMKPTDADRPVQDRTQTLLQDRRYGFDDQSRINRIDDLYRGQRRYGYDPLDQLTRVEERRPGDATATVQPENVDPAGNRLPDGLDQLLDNRLPFHGDRHFTYDEHGNLIRIQRGTDKRLEQRLGYNAKHQLIQLDDYKDGELQQRLLFRYDALGRRIDKEVHRWQHPTHLPFGSVDWSDDQKDHYLKSQPKELSRAYTEAYIWQGQKLIQTRHIDRKYKPVNCRMYAYEPDSHVPVAMYDQQLGLHHIDTDHAGTPKALYNHETGEEVWSTDHEVYGKILDTEAKIIHPVTGLSFEPNLRMQGQYEDIETGLYQNCYRFYDPNVGRYINQDPIGLLGGLNAYQYTPNPIDYIDPLGLSNKECGDWRLAGANNAIIDPRKLTEYALNPDHPRGKDKARVFEAALGFNQTNATDLLEQLREGVMNNTPIAGKVDQYGSRFTVDIPVVGPNGEAIVRTGWIYKPDSSVPEMTTLFVK
ncbi:DUF6883 domain-containing protein [Saccharospirillum salsuginis]|uniref:RHS repeat-associated core domain-containing protein n=1 Tax=Saccharospirillum salsuginis TaxID=418750 RepID=A0A918KJ69_9GAMM|nr:DUF6883 domain-containing protein [Saccharospirillum salsuginis]GGX64947.1 hypothetical protein GCM10007392_36010 [Saccharospirillum salsuginis]